FARLYANQPGVDPYTTVVSDVYQDLFGEGSFLGKGIYEVDAFEAATGGTFPENHILSHDHIEGCHARAGLVTDVELYDDFPASYQAYARRQHRWVRGDWQLLPWLFGRVPTASSPLSSPSGGEGHQQFPSPPEGEDRGEGGWRHNPLTTISRWKVLDNLRRSLLPPAFLLFLATGWLLLPGSPWVWTLAALAVLAFPVLVQASSILRVRPRSISWARHWRNSWGDLRTALAQLAL